jgi:anhydro-N-acetylmuramic acid kinase
MSGTSIDGVDYALCDVTANSVKLLRLWSRPFPPALRRRLHAAAANQCDARELAQLHHDLGRLYARQARALNAGAALAGLHGQTVFHQPRGSAPATLQIGEPAHLAEALRVPVVANFRAGDLAAGGQGAPLATMFHRVAFAKRGRHVCVNNLGGISNVTSLDWRAGNEPAVRAFDTGPANVLIDLAMRELTRGRLACDRNGAWAAQGQVHEPLLRRWLAHPFLRQRPPKSTGRELFGEVFWRHEETRMTAARLSKFDLLATLTEFTARSLALNYRLHLPAPPDVVILCGGGARNPFLSARVRAALAITTPDIELRTADEMGWPSESIEPAAFALLALLRWRNRTGNIPTTTGAGRTVVLGQVALP